MKWWERIRNAPVAVRAAEPEDRRALSLLLAATWRRHGAASLEDQAALLAGGTSVIALHGHQADAFLGATVREPAPDTREVWSDLTAAALDADVPVRATVAALADSLLPLLAAQGATGAACLCPDGWLRDGLLAAGFAERDRVLGYLRRPDRNLPPAPQAATLRQAGSADFDTIVALNAAAFDPLWRYDGTVLVSWYLTADHARIAEVGGRPVGFSLSNAANPNSYAYLVRIAVDPAYQGRGIGRQLVADAIDYALRESSSGLALNTQASNTLSRRLYESMGFGPAGQPMAVLLRDPL